MYGELINTRMLSLDVAMEIREKASHVTQLMNQGGAGAGGDPVGEQRGACPPPPPPPPPPYLPVASSFRPTDHAVYADINTGEVFYYSHSHAAHDEQQPWRRAAPTGVDVLGEE